MIADDDPRLSPLWVGRRDPFHAFHDALALFAGAYDLRDGRSTDPMSRVTVTVSDWHGQDIVGGRRIPLAAFEDLLFAVQQLRDLRVSENQQSGWTDQVIADRRSAVADHWQASGTDMGDFRASLRDRYEKAARLTSQPDQA
ncbi:hypothetical protein ACN6K5_000898 [Streptomyces violaceoruber]|uniref:hypothetical protein n=1 Tax=Streptomyces violaceoruber TaxID=1935 RepID=UPI00403D4BD6